MVLQSRLPAARKLLRLHSGFGTEPFVSADELLRKAPPLADGADFELRWRHWQEQCVLRLEAGEFGYSPRLQTLVKVSYTARALAPLARASDGDIRVRVYRVRRVCMCGRRLTYAGQGCHFCRQKVLYASCRF